MTLALSTGALTPEQGNGPGVESHPARSFWRTHMKETKELKAARAKLAKAEAAHERRVAKVADAAEELVESAEEVTLARQDLASLMAASNGTGKPVEATAAG